MRTEEEIVYEVREIVHGGEISSDSVIGERLIRSFLRKHRASKLYTFYKKGLTVSDIVVQELGLIDLDKINDTEYSKKLPAIINFDSNMGIFIDKENFNIPVLSSYKYFKSKYNILNSTLPKAKFSRDEIVVYIGKTDSCNFDEDAPKETAVKQFVEEAGSPSSKVYVNIQCVLYDPSEGKDYDWTRDPWPCPSEIIDMLTTSTLSRDLNLMINAHSDQVGNSRNDNIKLDAQ